MSSTLRWQQYLSLAILCDVKIGWVTYSHIEGLSINAWSSVCVCVWCVYIIKKSYLNVLFVRVLGFIFTRPLATGRLNSPSINYHQDKMLDILRCWKPCYILNIIYLLFIHLSLNFSRYNLLCFMFVNSRPVLEPSEQKIYSCFKEIIGNM